MADIVVREDMAVGDAETVLHLLPPAVVPSATIPTLVAAVASDPRARCAFVLDPDSRLLGVVDESDLDRDLALLLTPESTSVEQTGIRALSQAARGVHETAQHLMHPAVTVRVSDRIGDAVHRMRAGGEETAALIDGDGRLLGYLSLFEVLGALLEAAGGTASWVA
ncbi:MAG: CBS domain-containing protein [Candidatus Dormibacteria bacterium]